MKKLLIIFAILIALIVSISQTNYCNADEYTQEEIENEISENVDDQLDEIDLSVLDRYVYNLTDEQKDLFGSNSFVEKIEKLINGEFEGEYNNIFSAILSILFEEVLNYLPLMACIIAISVLSSIMNSIKSEKGKNIAELVHFVCYGTIVVILVKACASFIASTTVILTTLKTQMEVLMPILLTFLVAMGGVVSAKIYQPVAVALSSTIMGLMTKVLMPIFICAFVFAILSNLTKTVKFEKFQGFFLSLFKWISGTVFAVFIAFLTLQGITASTYDGVAIRTAKYTISGSIPIVGSLISSGFDIVLTSSMLIKNALGVGGVILVISTILIPVIKIAIFSLLLKLVSAVIEPIVDDRITNLVNSISKILPYLIALILGVAFMFSVSLLIVMLTANSFI